MNERELDNLVRMATEIDELERSALRFDSGTERRPLVVTLGLGQPRSRRWRIGLSALATAAALLVMMWSHPSSPPSQTTAPYCPANLAPSFNIAYWSGEGAPDGQRVACFEPQPAEQCSVLAIFHHWQEECQCVVWLVYEWEDGRALAELSPDDIRDITLEVTGAPPIEQLLVVAISGNPDDLPTSAIQAYELLACLNDVSPTNGINESSAEYASAARACLPDSVRIVPRTFRVE